MRRLAAVAMCIAALAPLARGEYADYMVIDLEPGALRRIAFYPAAEALPGGLISNAAYRTTKMVLRKIRAKGVPWTMGPFADGFVRHIELDSDFYIGVFEVTQAQAALVGGTKRPSAYVIEGGMRPVTSSSFLEIRDGVSKAGGKSPYPAPPAAESLIGRLRERAGGLALDLPSEAQWEFAARAGTGTLTPLGNYTSSDGASRDVYLRPVAWYDGNAGGNIHRVGTKMANDFGLYDMIGNIDECCLDWYAADYGIGSADVETTVFLEPEGPATGSDRSYRGGYCLYSYTVMYTASRHTYLQWFGARLMCPVGLLFPDAEKATPVAE